MTQGPGRILIADDEPSLLKMMAAYLIRLGHSVTLADTSERAWSEVERAPGSFAVAVLDASMQGVGFDQLALRMLNANPSLRVLVASGYPVDITALENAAAGRVAFLHKPFTPQMLVEVVRRMLATQEEGV